jgi:hypothetical protein
MVFFIYQSTNFETFSCYDLTFKSKLNYARNWKNNLDLTWKMEKYFNWVLNWSSWTLQGLSCLELSNLAKCNLKLMYEHC